MPRKIFRQIQLPMEKPDRCADCPLLGLIPENMKSADKADRYKSLICLGTSAALTKKFSEVRASKKDANHPHHRPCDGRWDAWCQLPGRKFAVTIEDSNTFLEPYYRTRQRVINFKWK